MTFLEAVLSRKTGRNLVQKKAQYRNEEEFLRLLK